MHERVDKCYGKSCGSAIKRCKEEIRKIEDVPKNMGLTRDD